VSRIDELIAELCPDGVEFLPMGDVLDMKAGRFIAASEVSAVQTAAHAVPCYGGNGIRGYVSHPSHEGQFALIGRQGALCGNVKRVDGKFYATEHAVVVTPCSDLDVDWVFHMLGVMNLNQYATRSAQPGLAVRTLEGVPLPVPPLEVQREIVRVLDTFTALESELEAELNAELEVRRRQYAHYRDALLTFPGGGLRWVPMGEVGEFIRGRRFTKADVVADGIPSIHYGDIYTRYGVAADETVSHVRRDLASQLRFARPGDVVIAAVGETVEDVGKAVAWLGDTDVAIHDDCFLYRHSMNAKFISYYLQTAAFHSQKSSHVARAKVKRLSGNGLAKIRIPIPPAEEQARIVAILDRFDALVNDLSSGLPAELAARRKQYEYYRDKLLTFEEAVA